MTEHERLATEYSEFRGKLTSWFDFYAGSMGGYAVLSFSEIMGWIPPETND